MPNDLIISITNYYGLQVNKIYNVQTGYRNKNYKIKLYDGDEINLIIYKQEPKIRNTISSAHYVGEFLNNKGYPVRNLYDKRIIRIGHGHTEHLAALYYYLPGTTISWEAYTMNHLKELGRSMSDVHYILKGLPQGRLDSFKTIYSAHYSRIKTYLCQSGVSGAMKCKLKVTYNTHALEAIDELLSVSDKLPNQQPIHLDYVRGNILFERNSSKITGVLDFEKSAFGNPVFDIARTLAFLYVDCKFKPEHKIHKYFLESGYNKYGKASFGQTVVHTKKYQHNLLEESMNIFLFHDFYKFLKHNPYESLYQNEHYIRTKELLIKRGILKSLA